MLSTANNQVNDATILRHAGHLLILFFTFMPNLAWIGLDQAVWPWDQAWYGEVATDLYSRFVSDATSWMGAMLAAFGTKAPGVAWIGQFFVPIGQMLGRIETGLMLSILIVQLTTLVFVYFIGLQLSDGSRTTALLGALFVAAAPLFVGLSHQFLVEPLQLAGVSYFWWIVLMLERLGTLSRFMHLGLATAMVMIAKATSPLYCLLPGLIILIKSIPGWSSAPPKERFGIPLIAGLVISAVALAFTGIWYLKNFQALASFVRQASSSAIALPYGSERAFLDKLIYWLGALKVGLAPTPYIWPILTIALINITGRALSGGWIALRHHIVPFLAALATVLIVLAIFSMNINEDTRYLIPLLPCLAVMLVWSMRPGQGRFAQWFCIALLFIQCSFMHMQGLNLVQPARGISHWLIPCRPDATGTNELNHIVEITSIAETANRINLCGVEYPWLNANSLSFFAAKRQLYTGYRSFYTSLGYAERDLDRAWGRMESLKSPFFISIELDQQEKPNFLNIVSAPFLERVRLDPRFSQIPYKSKKGVIIFKNTKMNSQ